MAEIEYQVDEMLFKMNALSGTSGLPEKVPFYQTDSEHNTESMPGSEVSPLLGVLVLKGTTVSVILFQ